MKKMLLTTAVAAFLLSACGGSTDVDPLTVIPEDVDILMSVDFSDSDAKAGFDEIMGRFPTKGLLVDEFKKELEYELEGDDFDFGDIKEILGDSWQIVLGMDLDDFENPTFYVAAKLADVDRFIELTDPAQNDGLIYEEDGDFQIWSTEPRKTASSRILKPASEPLIMSDYEYIEPYPYGGSYEQEILLVRYGDVFVYTNAASERDAIVERMKDEAGFTENEEVLEKLEDMVDGGFAHIYVSDELASNEFLTGIYGFDMTAGMGEAYVAIGTDDSGFVVISESNIEGGDEAMDKLVPRHKDGLKLIDKVNGDGIIYYSEAYGLGMALDAITNAVSAEALLYGEDIDIEKSIQDATGLGLAELKSLMEGAFAFDFSSKGGFIPAMALYLEIDEEDKKSAKALVDILDSGLTLFVNEAAGLMAMTGQAVDTDEIIKKEVVIVKGGPLHKLYLDMDALIEGTNGALGPMTGILGSQKIEFYYGVTGDNTVVLAFYPDFAEAYGTNVLAENDEFVSRMGDLDGVYSISYFTSDTLVEFLSGFSDFAALAGGGTEEFDEISDWIGTMKYLTSKTFYKDGVMEGFGQIVIEEVK